MGDEPIWARVGDLDYGAIEAPHSYGAERFDSAGNTCTPLSGQARSGSDDDWRVVGWVTSGGYGHRVKLSLAQGYLPAALVGYPKTNANLPDLAVEILGKRYSARYLETAPYDAEGARMRG